MLQMRKHLFFRKIPDLTFVEKLLNCFGIDAYGADITFTKEDLKNFKTLEHITCLLDELHTYYIPCKARVYLVNLDVQKCVTILRQIMRLHTVYLLSNQKMKNGLKSVYYTLIWPDRPQQLRKCDTGMVLTFD